MYACNQIYDKGLTPSPPLHVLGCGQPWTLNSSPPPLFEPPAPHMGSSRNSHPRGLISSQGSQPRQPPPPPHHPEGLPHQRWRPDSAPFPRRTGGEAGGSWRAVSCSPCVSGPSGQPLWFPCLTLLGGPLAESGDLNPPAPLSWGGWRLPSHLPRCSQLTWSPYLG